MTAQHQFKDSNFSVPVILFDQSKKIIQGGFKVHFINSNLIREIEVLQEVEKFENKFLISKIFQK